jgi:hypothetical protein
VRECESMRENVKACESCRTKLLDMQDEGMDEAIDRNAKIKQQPKITIESNYRLSIQAICTAPSPLLLSAMNLVLVATATNHFSSSPSSLQHLLPTTCLSQLPASSPSCRVSPSPRSRRPVSDSLLRSNKPPRWHTCAAWISIRNRSSIARLRSSVPSVPRPTRLLCCKT